MSELNNKEIEEQMERSEEKRDMALEIAEDNEEPPAFALGRRSREMGVYALLLGEKSKAVKLFVEATNWFRERWHQLRGEIDEPQMGMWSLYTAVLSRDDSLKSDVSQHLVDEGIQHREPEYYLHLDTCLANLILENTEMAIEAADKLIDVEPDTLKEVGSYPGLGGACHAIVDRDVDALDNALAGTLDYHEDRAEKHPESLDYILVCIPATVFLLLANDRGLAIGDTEVFQSEYIPDTLFE